MTLDKLTSGRLWLTIITGVVFAYASWKKILDAQAIASIVTMVFQAYFLRNDRNGKPTEGGQK